MIPGGALFPPMLRPPLMIDDARGDDTTTLLDPDLPPPFAKTSSNPAKTADQVPTLNDRLDEKRQRGRDRLAPLSLNPTMNAL